MLIILYVITIIISWLMQRAILLLDDEEGKLTNNPLGLLLIALFLPGLNIIVSGVIYLCKLGEREDVFRKIYRM